MADQEIPTSNGMSTSNSPDNQDKSANQGTAEDSKDVSQSNANAGQSTSTSSTKDSKCVSQSNASAGQSTSTTSTKDSKDASQSNVNADQSTNTEGSQDTPNSNAAKNRKTSSSTLHLTKQSVSTSTVISTSRSLFPSTSSPFIKDAANAAFRVEALFLLAAFLVGCEASRSKLAFSLVIFSFLGGSEYSQRVPFHILLYFVAGFWVGVGAATVYIMLLLCLIAYACELNTRDAVLVGFSFLFGLLCNVSDQAFFLVVYSYFGGMVVRFDKEALIYLGLSFLIGSTGAFNFLAIPFSLPF